MVLAAIQADMLPLGLRAGAPLGPHWPRRREPHGRRRRSHHLGAGLSLGVPFPLLYGAATGDHPNAKTTPKETLILLHGGLEDPLGPGYFFRFLYKRGVFHVPSVSIWDILGGMSW